MREDAESSFKRDKAKLYRRSVAEEMKLLRDTYRIAVMVQPYRDTGAYALSCLWELDKMQRKEAKGWIERTYAERRRLTAVLKYLRMNGVTSVDYEEVMPGMWEDVAALLFLMGSWGLQRAFPNLTWEVLGK